MFYDEISENLRLFGRIIEERDLVLSDWDYRFYTKGIYHVDDIASWKVDKKLEYMMSVKSESYHIRMIVLEITQPSFRLKSLTNNTISQKCELIKKLIRDAYKTKIENYFYDIIMHIGDNFYQNAYIYKLMTMPQIDFTSI